MKILKQENNHCLVIVEKNKTFNLCLAELINGELIIIKEIESSKTDKKWNKFDKISLKDCLKMIKN